MPESDDEAASNSQADHKKSKDGKGKPVEVAEDDIVIDGNSSEEGGNKGHGNNVDEDAQSHSSGGQVEWEDCSSAGSSYEERRTHANDHYRLAFKPVFHESTIVPTKRRSAQASSARGKATKKSHHYIAKSAAKEPKRKAERDHSSESSDSSENDIPAMADAMIRRRYKPRKNKRSTKRRRRDSRDS